MLRGSVVIFTGVLSVLVLKRKLFGFHILGMFLVLVGLALVGISSVINKPAAGTAVPSDPIVGDLLVIMAQMVVAVQMVYEEQFIGKYKVPALQAVGWEGYWGCVVCLSTLVVLYFIPSTAENALDDRYENSVDAVVQIYNSPDLMLATIGVITSIAFFNYFGISVTKVFSATTRMVLDSLRTVVIWAVSLMIGWQGFAWIQVAGFVVLLLGTCIYNKIFRVPFLAYRTEGESSHALLDNVQQAEKPAPTDSPMYFYRSDTPGPNARSKQGIFKPSARGG